MTPGTYYTAAGIALCAGIALVAPTVRAVLAIAHRLELAARRRADRPYPRRTP